MIKNFDRFGSESRGSKWEKPPDRKWTENELRSGKHNGNEVSASVTGPMFLSSMHDKSQLARAVHLAKITTKTFPGIRVVRVSCVSCPQGRLGKNQDSVGTERETERRFGADNSAASSSLHGSKTRAWTDMLIDSRLSNDPGRTESSFFRPRVETAM